MQGIRVPYLVQADATCLRATTEPAHPEPVLHKRSHCSEKPCSTTRAWPLLAVTRESLSSDKDPAQPKKKKVSRLSLGLFLSLCPGIYGLNSHISPREVTHPPPPQPLAPLPHRLVLEDNCCVDLVRIMAP